MIYIGIDISIDSTAVCVEKENEIILFNYTTNNAKYKWNDLLKNDVRFRFIEYLYKKEDFYSESQLIQLNEFDDLTTIIASDIKRLIDLNECIIGIEGYNYGLRSTDIIVDIVTFSTLLRNKIKNFGEIRILSPKTIKMTTCEMVYGLQYASAKSKNVSRNKNGIPGGKFQKADMVQAYYDSNLQSPIYEIIKKDVEKIISKNGKDARKPFDDLVDSIFIKEIIKL